MSEEKAAAPTVDEIIARIHELQQEIVEREDRIVELVDSVSRPAALEALVEEGVERRRLRHLERLIADWDALVARSRAVSEDDIDLVAALVRLVGDLLVVQIDGLDSKWISRLEGYLADQRAKVS